MRFFFLAFVALLPFQIALNPLPGVDLALSRVFVLGLFFIFAALLLYGKVSLPYSLTSVLVVAFFGFAVFSLLYAPHVSSALRRVVFLLNFAPLFFIAWYAFSQRGAVRAFTDVLLYSGLFVCAIGIVQFFAQFIIGYQGVFSAFSSVASVLYGKEFGQAILTHNSWLVNVSGHTLFRAIAFFPDPHIFGFYLSFITPLALFSSRNIFRIFGFVFIVTLALTFSRGAYVGFIGSFISYGALVFVPTLIKGHYLFSGLRAFFAVLAIVFLLGAFLFSPIGSRLASSFSLDEGSNASRLALWGQALELIWVHPILGYGLGGFALALEPSVDDRTPIYAHNIYLDLWAELGIVGLSLFLLLLWHTLYSLLYLFSYGPIYRALFVSFLWFSLQAFFDTPLFSVHILPLLLIFLALADYAICRARKAS